MDQKRNAAIRQINYLTSEIDALYHLAALKLGLSDSACIVLYTICDAGESCLLRDIYRMSGVSKQTINSAIRGLEKDEIVYLEHQAGQKKRVFLTEKGKSYTAQTVARLYEAEGRTYESWTPEEVREYIRLTEKYADCFRKQLEQL